MAIMRKRTFEREYVQIPNITARATEIKNNDNPISLEALGLLTNLQSYPEEWDLHKTELYKRFAFNKERSVKRIWNELIAAGYMIEFKYRVGKKWEYVYTYNVIPYTEEEKALILAESREKYGEIWGLQNADFKKETSTCGQEDADIINTVLKKNGLNKKYIKEIDDDEKTPSGENFENEMNDYLFFEFKKEFQAEYPNVLSDEKFDEIYHQMQKQGINEIYIDEAVQQIRRMTQYEKETGKIVADFAAFFVFGIKSNRKSNEIARGKEKERRFIKKQSENKQKDDGENKIHIPFYNWLDS